MNLRKSSLVLALVGIAGAASAQTSIAYWNFNTLESPNYNSPAATSGANASTAVANAIGMVGGAACDVVATGTDPNPNSTGNAWRVRGANGWANGVAEYTQGAELSISTVGYTNLTFSFDFFCTTQGIKDLALLYTTNGGTSWNLYDGSYAGNVATVQSGGATLLVATSNGYNTAGTNVTTNTVSFAGLAGVANNANFGIELVSAYDPNLPAGEYGSAAAGTSGDVQYNGTSGNWRFDQFQLSGTAQAVPEVPSVVFFAIAGLSLVALRAKRA